MLNSERLTRAEVRVRWLMHHATPDETEELARLGVLLHVMREVSVSPEGREKLDDLLARVAPEFLLTLRALGELAGQVIRRARS